MPARDFQLEVDVTSKADLRWVCLTLLQCFFGHHFETFASKFGDFF